MTSLACRYPGFCCQPPRALPNERHDNIDSIPRKQILQKAGLAVTFVTTYHATASRAATRVKARASSSNNSNNRNTCLSSRSHARCGTMPPRAEPLRTAALRFSTPRLGPEWHSLTSAPSPCCPKKMHICSNPAPLAPLNLEREYIRKLGEYPLSSCTSVHLWYIAHVIWFEASYHWGQVDRLSRLSDVLQVAILCCK